MSILNSDEYSEISEQLIFIKNQKKQIKDKITHLNDQLNNLEIDEYLLNIKSESPKLIFTGKNIGKYRYISEMVYIDHLKLYLYPVWLQIECTYPKWSRDYLSINLVQYYDYLEGVGYECLIDGLVSGLGCSYETAKNIIIDENLNIPPTFIFDCNIGSNFIIDFDSGIPVSRGEVSKQSYHLTVTDDENMVSNIAKIKYILILPRYFSDQN